MFLIAPKATAECPSYLTKCFRHLVPVHPGEQSTLQEDTSELGKAKKCARKHLKKIELKCTDIEKFSQAARTYLNSLRCLQAAMLEVNKGLPLEQRLSIRQILDVSKTYKVLEKLDEKASVRLKLKSSGNGFRPICDFGPVARGAQRMALHLVRAINKLAEFQYTRRGVHEAISKACKLIKKEGYHHVADVDIINHFPSFTLDALTKSIPLPKAAIREIVMAGSIDWVTIKSPFMDNVLSCPVPHGIPQGSAASSAVAEWSVSQLKLIEVPETALLNYADNFFLFAKNQSAMDAALEALSLAITKLPGGTFSSKVKQTRTTAQGFSMLGLWIWFSEGEIEIMLTNENTQRLRRNFERSLQYAKERLLAYEKSSNPQDRQVGVQSYLRAQGQVIGWASIYAMCKDMPMFRDDLLSELAVTGQVFEITEAELKAAADAYTAPRYVPYM